MRELSMPESKRGPGRPATLSKEERREQVRNGKKVFRAKAKSAGKVRLDAMVDAETKATLETYRKQNGLKNLGEAIDAMVSR
ncbi:hypothetical protein A9R05_42515 (plasmid) [Burkholderia sp. KK1]|nr:hypothetical protein A9R05_42515 [Burkholderia sp. KK1]